MKNLNPLVRRGARHIGLSLALCLAGLGLVREAAAQAMDKVIFARAAPWGLVDAQILFGIELGFFKQERIDPEFVVVGGSYAAVQQILAGRAQVGYAGTEAIPVSMQAGNTPIPLRMVYNYFRSPIFEIVVPAQSPVQKLADLQGKTIGVLSLTTGSVPITKAALAASGLAQGGYTLQPVGAGAQAVQALTSGAIDALNLWHTLHAQMEENGIAIRRLPFPPEFDRMPSTGLAFSESFIRSNPDVVARYGRAMAKSTVACMANPQSCVRAYWRAYPAQKPAGPEAQAMTNALHVMDVSFKRLVVAKGETRHGAYDQADWDNLLKALQAGGAIVDAKIPLDKVYTNAFVDEYNKFDRAQVEALAKAAK